ncbi:hypothetical protein QFC22_005495 [Naganishia vaughanmartiniae]|uniref:Uncharacterized protein n=1 Tax=Naganishia vaughanmartiniae TaxID=1424756 RepID=A0ACC2WSL1_9TREE|nr:hypothetical protein QFC22_005495 [Naganishia vaughanmartiniae]
MVSSPCSPSYAAAMQIPPDSVYAAVSPQLPVPELLDVPDLNIYPSAPDPVFSKQQPQYWPPNDCFPQERRIRILDDSVRERWEDGYRSLLFITSESGTQVLVPLWSILYWKHVFEVMHAKARWRSTMGFIPDVIFRLSFRKPTGSEEQRIATRGWHTFNQIGWRVPLFTAQLRVNHHSLHLASILHQANWYDYGHMHCGLVNLRARYQHRLPYIELAHSELHDKIVQIFGQGMPAPHQIPSELLGVIMWLRQYPDRHIAAVVHLEERQHWAVVLAGSTGKVRVADSLTGDHLPSWWFEVKKAYQRFLETVNSSYVMRAEAANLGKQKDFYNCGPATLTAIENFLDDNSSKWEEQDPNYHRLRIATEIANATKDCPSAFPNANTWAIPWPRPDGTFDSQLNNAFLQLQRQRQTPRMRGGDPKNWEFVPLTEQKAEERAVKAAPSPVLQYASDTCQTVGSNSAGPSDVSMTVRADFADSESDDEPLASATSRSKTSILGSETVDLTLHTSSEVEKAESQASWIPETSRQPTKSLEGAQGQTSHSPPHNILDIVSPPPSSVLVTDMHAGLESCDSYDADGSSSPESQMGVIVDPHRRTKRKLEADTSAIAESSGGTSSDTATKKKRVPCRKNKNAAQRSDVFRTAMTTGEIKAYERHQFTCNCPKAGPHRMNDIAFDVFKLKQHRNTAAHKRWWDRAQLEDGNGSQLDFSALPACLGLRGETYIPLFSSITDWGGIQEGCTIWGRLSLRLFPYKHGLRDIQPQDGDANTSPAYACWTDNETAIFEAERALSALWQLDRAAKSVRSTSCERRVMGDSTERICEACRKLQNDEKFKRALRKKKFVENQLNAMPLNERELAIKSKIRNTPKNQCTPSMRIAQVYLENRAVMRFYQLMEDTDKPTASIFRKLEQMANAGEFNDDDTLQGIFKLIYESKSRRADPTGKAIHGIRYSEDVMHFFVLLRSRGISSTGPFAAIRGIFHGGPGDRYIRAWIASRQTGFIVFGAIDKDRVKNFMDRMKKCGLMDVPLCVSADATVLPSDEKRPALAFVKLFAKEGIKGHLVGSALSMAETAVKKNADLETICDNIDATKNYATQVLAVMITCPLDGVPPMVVALYPIKKSVNQTILSKILEDVRLEIQKHGGKVIAYATDGGSPERGAQKTLKARFLSRKKVKHLEVFVRDLNFKLTTPVVDGHPLIMIQDPEHARKTLRNNFRSGATLLDLGGAVLAYETLLGMLQYSGHGLAITDLVGGDKQDDGAALRLFHSIALRSLVVDGKVREGMEGLFIVLFVFGKSKETITLSQSNV